MTTGSIESSDAAGIAVAMAAPATMPPLLTPWARGGGGGAAAAPRAGAAVGAAEAPTDGPPFAAALSHADFAGAATGAPPLGTFLATTAATVPGPAAVAGAALPPPP
eukprot:366000-Chlamydomonas_euryale.AAC.66